MDSSEYQHNIRWEWGNILLCIRGSCVWFSIIWVVFGDEKKIFFGDQSIYDFYKEYLVLIALLNILMI